MREQSQASTRTPDSSRRTQATFVETQRFFDDLRSMGVEVEVAF